MSTVHFAGRMVGTLFFATVLLIFFLIEGGNDDVILSSEFIIGGRVFLINQKLFLELEFEFILLIGFHVDVGFTC